MILQAYVLYNSCTSKDFSKPAVFKSIYLLREGTLQGTTTSIRMDLQEIAMKVYSTLSVKIFRNSSSFVSYTGYISFSFEKGT